DLVRPGRVALLAGRSLRRSLGSGRTGEDEARGASREQEMSNAVHPAWLSAFGPIAGTPVRGNSGGEGPAAPQERWGDRLRRLRRRKLFVSARLAAALPRHCSRGD